MRGDGLAAFVLRLAQRLRGGLAPRIIERACQRQAPVLQPFLRRAGWARRQGRGGRLPARSAWTPCPARRACRARALSVRPGPVAPSAPPGGPPARDGYRHGWSDGTGPDAARSAPRPGHAGWPASHPPPAGPGPGRFLGRCVGVQAGCVFVQGTPCRQVAIRASDAHATPQTRADSASAWYSHSRAKSRLAARKRGTCQFMKSRSGALAKPLRRASCRAASCHCSRAKYTRLA